LVDRRGEFSTVSSNTSAVSLAPWKQQLIAFYLCWFVLNPERGYYEMNPIACRNTYLHKTEPLTLDMLVCAFDDGTRRLKLDGRMVPVPLSFATRLVASNGLARWAVLNIDSGGEAAVRRVLDVCAAHGLWASAVLSESAHHSGGHVYVPLAVPILAVHCANLAKSIQLASDVPADCYPAGNKPLRLPLMHHLHAPGGPRRFPIIVSDGTVIPESTAWPMLAQLRDSWRPNTLEQVVVALARLPHTFLPRVTPIHRSRVSISNPEQVIRHFNQHHALTEFLPLANVPQGMALMKCPAHNDTGYSLAVFQHPAGYHVCRCLSMDADCPLAAEHDIDAFTLYSWEHQLDTQTAVQQIIEDECLGQQRTWKITGALTPPPVDPHALAVQEALLKAGRARLRDELRQAVERPGQVTFICATPGLGKTHFAAELANQLYAEGKRVAIIVPTHAIAEQEWLPRLINPLIWQPRTRMCTCVAGERLERLAQLGYQPLSCKRGCPYQAQRAKRRGHIVVYQHNHLHLQDSELLCDVDVIIVDEGIAGALLAERIITREELEALLQRLGLEDPAAPLVTLLLETRRAAGREPITGLVFLLAQRSSQPLDELIRQAKTSPEMTVSTVVRASTLVETLPARVLPALIAALEHDLTMPNPRLTCDGEVWYLCEKRRFLAAPRAQVEPPAVVVLDGSANELVGAALVRPWPSSVVNIHVPISPDVWVIQCTGTASTRRFIHEPERVRTLMEQIAGAAAHLGFVFDGGVTYKAAQEIAEQMLGGTWIHYGGQRGHNGLSDKHAIATIGSPTYPPNAAKRQALVLFSDEAEPLCLDAERIGCAEYRANDPRLQAYTRMCALEELGQALHRIRPIEVKGPKVLFIASPWDLSPLGVTPQTVVEQVPYGNNRAVKQGMEDYQRLQLVREEVSTGE
jgi:hypothetical protein